MASLSSKTWPSPSIIAVCWFNGLLLGKNCDCNRDAAPMRNAIPRSSGCQHELSGRDAIPIQIQRKPRLLLFFIRAIEPVNEAALVELAQNPIVHQLFDLRIL